MPQELKQQMSEDSRIANDKIKKIPSVAEYLANGVSHLIKNQYKYNIFRLIWKMLSENHNEDAQTSALPPHTRRRKKDEYDR